MSSLLFDKIYSVNTKHIRLLKEASLQRCSQEKVYWKYTANLQENTHGEVWI